MDHGSVLRPVDLTIALLERIRLILRGGSIIDWYRLDVQTQEDARSFLLVNGFDVGSPRDVERLRHLLGAARDYLRVEHGFDTPPEVYDPVDVLDPFLLASQTGQPGQREACILLKVAHTINHTEARELRMGLALREVEVMARVEPLVGRAIARLQAAGYPIHAFAGSRKSLASTVTKLLSKRRATAAQILDRLRFRIIVDHARDIPLVLAALTRSLLPYNYVVPEETTNDMMTFRSVLARLDHVTSQLGQLQFALSLEDRDPRRREVNECSADEFRMLSFVVDMPVRIDDVLERPENAHLAHLGFVVFINVEFQMFDCSTWRANESSEHASHDAYKERQRQRVQQRLLHGLEGGSLTAESIAAVVTDDMGQT